MDSVAGAGTAEIGVERPQVYQEGGCPSCGAPVQFTVGTARIKVCDFCQTVVAREGEELYATGKLSALAETATPFSIGLEGRHEGVPFRFVGHLQKDYDDGVWDEWYLAFEDGRFGWLSESEGALHLMFPRGTQPLERRHFRPGHETHYAGRRVVVEEIRQSQLISAEGELPDDLEQGMTIAADATGPGGVFLTFDFGTREREPEVFLGRRIALSDLGIRPEHLRDAKPKKVRVQGARCTQCNGTLDLKAPDKLKRVACPFCGALLEARGEKLAFLNGLPQPDHPLRIPLHTQGRLGDVSWTVIGWMQRSATVDGVRYPWDEYLLWSPKEGFSFLMDSNGHWTHLLPIPAGEVRVHVETSAYYQGTRYKAFQHVEAITENVRGEFYWRVSAGEKAEATEYIAPPHSINADATNREVTYTHGTYYAPEVIAQAFRLKKPLPAPTGVAPSQPNPHHAGMVRDLQWLMVYAVAAIFLFVFLSSRAARETVYEQEYSLWMPPPPGQTFFSQPFEISRAGNAQIRFQIRDLQNEWVGVQLDLVDAKGDVRSVYKEMTYYSGGSMDGSWSEGSRTWTTHLSRLPAGTYSLRVVPYYDRLATTRNLRVTIISDVPRPIYLMVVLGVLALMAAFLIVRRASFETGRWFESNLVDHG
jgi:hypothetical protein